MTLKKIYRAKKNTKNEITKKKPNEVKRNIWDETAE